MPFLVSHLTPVHVADRAATVTWCVADEVIMSPERFILKRPRIDDGFAVRRCASSGVLFSTREAEGWITVVVAEKR